MMGFDRDRQPSTAEIVRLSQPSLSHLQQRQQPAQARFFIKGILPDSHRQ
jgi:hypothetical protein